MVTQVSILRINITRLERRGRVAGTGTRGINVGRVRSAYNYAMKNPTRFITISEFAAQALEHEATWTPPCYKERIKWLHESAQMLRESGSQSLIEESAA